VRITSLLASTSRAQPLFRPRAQADFELIARFIAGEASRDDVLELDAWIGEAPERGRLVMQLAALWDRDASADGERATDELWRVLAAAAGIGTDDREVGRPEPPVR
jgi:hypothetical protein